MWASRYFPSRYFARRYWPELPAIAVPTSLRRALFAQETEEAFIVLLTIDHANLLTPQRFAHNTVDFISRGETYLAYPFEIDLPGQDPERPPRVTLRIDNVSREIVLTLRQIQSAPTVTMEVVMASTPDNVEAGPYEFTLRSVDGDAFLIEGELSFEDILNDAYPAGDFTPATHPGLF